jgi:hypothetical protein
LRREKKKRGEDIFVHGREENELRRKDRKKVTLMFFTMRGRKRRDVFVMT